MNVLDRFLTYVTFDTTSDENATCTPSTEKQKVLGQSLAEEMLKMGIEDAHMDGHGYVYGTIPATKGYEDIPALGLIAHMDTAPAVSGTGVHPRVVLYEGGELPLGAGESLSPKAFSEMENYIGKDLVVTDGTTLLGADDKAGIAEILTACQEMLTHPERPHRKVAICFTPDEEVGRGTEKFDFEKFPAKVAYTVDGGELGEIEYENFNAASAVIRIKGVNIHPGYAKNKMKNAALLAAKFIEMLPAAETPAHTEGYEGFYHVCSVSGCETDAEIQLIVRDHDRERFEARKAFLQTLCTCMNELHGSGTFTPDITDSYYNMKEQILPHMELIENAKAAMRAAGVEPKIVPVRGGTDGARLSYEGIPCPNLSTGGLNFHGIHEYIPVESLEKMVLVLLELTKA